jgi:hypothetical protein
VRDQVSNPCKTRDKIIVMYILIFKRLESKWEDELNDNKHLLNLICCYFVHECNFHLLLFLPHFHRIYEQLVNYCHFVCEDNKCVNNI